MRADCVSPVAFTADWMRTLILLRKLEKVSERGYVPLLTIPIFASSRATSK